MSDKLFPIYSPLLFEFDATRLFNEIISTRSHWFFLPPVARFAKSPRYFEVAAAEYYRNCEYVEVTNEGRVFHPGRRTWRGLNLRRHPADENSKYGLVSQRGKLPTGWKWADFDIAYTKEVIERLPYDELEMVRVMSIDVGGFGPVHTDVSTDDLWEKQGFAATTLVLGNGGVDMVVQGATCRFTTPAPAFFFKDCVPHGVPPVSSRRIILRISGKVNYNDYRKVMDLDAAVWA